MLQYLLNATAIWLVSLLSFDLFLRRENYHVYNRFYLVFTFLLGLLLPLQNLLSGSVLLEGGGAKWAAYIYIGGAAAAFLWLIVDILQLVVIYRRGSKTADGGWTIVETGKEHPPFSYLDILFVTARQHYSDREWEMIVSHERQHSVQLHLVDMLLMQLSRIALWFHPLVYIYQARLQLVHEYQADRVSAKETDTYGKFLLEQAVLKAAPTFSHSFNRSPIKKRIIMLTRNIKPRTGLSNLKLLIVVPLTALCVVFFSTNSFSIEKPGEVWKKQVIRMIDMSEPYDTATHHLRPVGDTSLLELMLTAIYSGKVTAYSRYDDHLSIKMTKDQVKEEFETKPDTVILTDPVTGKEVTKIARHDYDYSLITKYMIMEEWTYDQRTRKTEVRILAVAPGKDVVVEGKVRGTMQIFWLRYNDIRSILDRYELYHPDNTLERHIWDDNFKAVKW